MRATTALLVSLALLLAAPLVATAAAAQQTSPAHRHMGHVADGFRGTPEGQGLLPAAIAEAEIAARHAGLAAGDLSNLGGMKRHAGHVLNAVDPSQMESGPGLGYGVKRAAEGVVTHIELAAGSEGASQNVGTHANHIATSARNTVERADRIAALAKEIAEASSASDAAALVAEMNELAQALVAGHDANMDGRTGWQAGEGGLEQAQAHMGFMKRGEGIGD